MKKLTHFKRHKRTSADLGTNSCAPRGGWCTPVHNPASAGGGPASTPPPEQQGGIADLPSGFFSAKPDKCMKLWANTFSEASFLVIFDTF